MTIFGIWSREHVAFIDTTFVFNLDFVCFLLLLFLQKLFKMQRSVIERCEYCNIDFFHKGRLEIHLNSRQHKQKMVEMPQQHFNLENDLSKESVLLPKDEHMPLIRNESTTQLIENDVIFGICNENDDEENDWDDDDDDSFEHNAYLHGDEKVTENEENEFFPFPSKLFFLLYTYVHGVSRPKVSSSA